jgi:hypothetical protein
VRPLRRSLSAQPREESACPEEQSFIKSREWRMTAIPDLFVRRIDLVERGLSHNGVPTPLGNKHQSAALIAETRGPLERDALARPFLQRLAIGNDRLFELRRGRR